MNELALLLRVLFGAALRAFFPALFAEVKESFRDTASDARPQPELKNRLSRRIRARWGRRALAGGALMLACVCLAGCGTRTIFIPDGQPVRLREPIPNAKVWVMGEDGKPVASKVELPAGWYVLADPGDTSEPPKPEKPPAPSGAPIPDIPIFYATPAPVARPLIPGK